jgi:lipopolysaccharide heptosyltransferase I
VRESALEGESLVSVDATTARRILIVRLSSLGDVVHALPLLDALRRARPDAHLGWLVEEAAASLLEGHPQLDRLFVVPRREALALARAGRWATAGGRFRTLFGELRAERFEWSLDAQSNLRSGLLARASGASRRVGFAPPFSKEHAHWLLTDPVSVPAGNQLKVERNLELLRPLGIEPGPARAQVPVSESARRFAAEVLRAPGPWVALHPGVSGMGSFKQWEPERFSQVARRLEASYGARVLVTWGPGEEALAQRVARGAEGSARVAPATASLQELAALYQGCAAVAGSDTGPVHLAAALGVPTVALFGPKDPAIYAPWQAQSGRAARVIWKGVHCSPCGKRRCGNIICMPAIGVEEVVRALGESLEDVVNGARLAGSVGQPA